ncbi:MAG: hypothetical protein ACRYF2_08835 [Janthinobacterium lividum]
MRVRAVGSTAGDTGRAANNVGDYLARRRRSAAMPTRPEPSSAMLTGSGTDWRVPKARSSSSNALTVLVRTMDWKGCVELMLT